ncbi:endolytic transglycosylase MltG [Saccharicrinis sp. FJH54]|uniref:endolytic transglycosylase MltG n=1 Tax=Saccharicrinis sp. FJH54 TaxID=3344665 RepID=UPI0035D52866
MKKLVKYVSIIILIIIIPLAIILYTTVLGSNIKETKTGFTELFVGENVTLDSLLNDSLPLGKVINHKKTILLTAKLKRFSGYVKPGKYIIKEGMSNNELINIFRSGNQNPITLTFNNIRTKNDLSGNLGKQLLADSVELLSVLNNSSFLASQGFNTYTAVCPFLPDSYEVYWTITPKDLYERMVYEYNKFWNQNRLNKAKAIGMTPEEVVTLASIVNEESNFKDEQPIIAGLYINRIKRGYLLQADPTLKFALNDFEKKRVINEDKEIDSPYNTYKFKGLPPGPIRIPTKTAIDAVLNYKKHKYLYMCAKADFSGEHHFSETFSEHKKYAREYQKKLNSMRIYK